MSRLWSRKRKPDIANLVQRRDVLGLVQMLRNGYPVETRARAASGLGQIGDVSAVDALVTALDDDAPSVRYKAVDALGQIGDASAVDALLAALRDGDRYVRHGAARELARFGYLRAVKVLNEVWAADGRGDDAVTASFVRELAPVGTDVLFAALDLPSCEALALRALAGRGGPAAARLLPLLAARHDCPLPEGDVKAVVAAAPEALIPLLDDEDADIRCRALFMAKHQDDVPDIQRAVSVQVSVLERSKDVETLLKLADASGGFSDAIRVQAMAALQRIIVQVSDLERGKDVETLLKLAYMSDDFSDASQVRKMARAALGAQVAVLERSKDVETLKKLAYRFGGFEYGVQVQAMGALGRIGCDSGAADALVPDPELWDAERCKVALKALNQIAARSGGLSVLSRSGRARLFSALCTPARAMIMKILAENGEVLDQLVKIVETGSEKEKYLVFESMPDPRSVDVLLDNVYDSEDRKIVNIEAAAALDRLLEHHPKVFTTSQLERVRQLHLGTFSASHESDYSWDWPTWETETWEPTHLRKLAAEELRLRQGLTADQLRLRHERALWASPTGLTCCLDCVNRGCDKSMGGKVDWTRSASRCDCQVHHRTQ